MYTVVNPRRSLPSVDRVLHSLGPTPLPRPVLVATIRAELSRFRATRGIPNAEAVFARVQEAVRRLERARLQPVINATGVIVHTNLGRAPLGPPAVEALVSIAGRCTNLELDLETGERGHRAAYVEQLLALLCQAKAATVVNNCAAALVLILKHFTAGARKEVLISRGELVQIGGGFRIPEILEQSGARLREVGTTNRTCLADYSRAIGRGTALLLRVHRSNFFMGGFVESVPTQQLAALAARKRLPLVEDLGSGAMIDTARLAGTVHEPTPAESLRNGADLVCFSGDKLFGGPQAGVIAGRSGQIAELKRDPFFRALRCDKLILTALQATAESWLKVPAGAEARGTVIGIPVAQQMRLDRSQLETRATKLLEAWSELPAETTITRSHGEVGGGALPGALIDSVCIELKPHKLGASELARRLRLGSPPVIGVVRRGRFRLDLRTVFAGQDAALARAVSQAMLAATS